jgi:hypothetical protein
VFSGTYTVLCRYRGADGWINPASIGECDGIYLRRNVLHFFVNVLSCAFLAPPVRPKSLPENEHFPGVLGHGWKVFLKKDDSLRGAYAPCLKKAAALVLAL